MTRAPRRGAGGAGRGEGKGVGPKVSCPEQPGEIIQLYSVCHGNTFVRVTKRLALVSQRLAWVQEGVGLFRFGFYYDIFFLRHSFFFYNTLFKAVFFIVPCYEFMMYFLVCSFIETSYLILYRSSGNANIFFIIFFYN